MGIHVEAQNMKCLVKISPSYARFGGLPLSTQRRRLVYPPTPQQLAELRLTERKVMNEFNHLPKICEMNDVASGNRPEVNINSFTTMPWSIFYSFQNTFREERSEIVYKFDRAQPHVQQFLVQISNLKELS
jgi:hypothetical protein